MRKINTLTFRQLTAALIGAAVLLPMALTGCAEYEPTVKTYSQGLAVEPYRDVVSEAVTVEYADVGVRQAFTVTDLQIAVGEGEKGLSFMISNNLAGEAEAEVHADWLDAEGRVSASSDVLRERIRPRGYVPELIPIPQGAAGVILRVKFPDILPTWTPPSVRNEQKPVVPDAEMRNRALLDGIEKR